MSNVTSIRNRTSSSESEQVHGPVLRIAAIPWRVVNWFGGSAERHWQNIFAAIIQVWANKSRSVLTTLGIIIAVTSTITVVSFVQGFGNYVTDMLRGFGTNMVFVIPASPGGKTGRMMGRVVMDKEDIRAVGAQCDKVRRITPLMFSNVTVEYGHEKVAGVELQGATEQFQTIRNFYVDSGRFYGPIDVDNGAYVCALGREVLNELGADESIVGDYVFLNDHRFKVLGLLEKKGAVFGDSQDRLALIPHSTGVKMFPFLSRFLPFVLEVIQEEDVEEATLQITQVLRTRHNIQPGQPNDFRILRQDELLKDFSKVQMVATSVLAGIVGISLIVGGVGIMNIMLVSVTERTREIGLRKSIGGRRRDILMQFLTEAMVLSMLGGVVGIICGYSICAITSLHPSMVEVKVPVWVVAIALGFSASVGVIFGNIPAFKAAILHPIDALRHE